VQGITEALFFSHLAFRSVLVPWDGLAVPYLPTNTIAPHPALSFGEGVAETKAKIVAEVRFGLCDCLLSQGEELLAQTVASVDRW
jgi:hypothetical protein